MNEMREQDLIPWGLDILSACFPINLLHIVCLRLSVYLYKYQDDQEVPWPHPIYCVSSCIGHQRRVCVYLLKYIATYTEEAYVVVLGSMRTIKGAIYSSRQNHKTAK